MIALEREWPQSKNGLLCRVCATKNGKGGVWMHNDKNGNSRCPKCGRTHEGLLRYGIKRDGSAGYILVAA